MFLTKTQTKIVYYVQYIIFMIVIISSFDNILIDIADAAPNRKNSKI